jgi:hypothetical protein
VISDHNAPTANYFPGRPLEGRNWVDRSAGENAHVGLIPGTINARGGVPFFDDYLNQAEWWDVDFWNKSIRSVYSVGGTGAILPVKARTRWESGELELPGEAPDHIVMAESDIRFAPMTKSRIVDQGDLALYRTPDPSRLAWISRGVSDDGWTSPEEPTLVRVFGNPEERPTVWRLRIRMYAGADVPGGRDYVLRFGETKVTGGVTTTSDATATACVPSTGHVTARLQPRGSTAFGSGRRVGVRVVTIRAASTGRHCTPSRTET